MPETPTHSEMLVTMEKWLELHMVFRWEQVITNLAAETIIMGSRQSRWWYRITPAQMTNSKGRKKAWKHDFIIFQERHDHYAKSDGRQGRCYE